MLFGEGCREVVIQFWQWDAELVYSVSGDHQLVSPSNCVQWFSYFIFQTFQSHRFVASRSVWTERVNFGPPPMVDVSEVQFHDMVLRVGWSFSSIAKSTA